MAIMPNSPWDPYYDTISQTKDHVIQGDMVVANYKMDEFEYDGKRAMLGSGFDNYIKGELIKLLCEEMAATKRIEYTKSQDQFDGSVLFRARIFATPDSMVRVVRELLKNNT